MTFSTLTLNLFATLPVLVDNVETDFFMIHRENILFGSRMNLLRVCVIADVNRDCFEQFSVGERANIMQCFFSIQQLVLRGDCNMNAGMNPPSAYHMFGEISEGS